MGAGASSTKSVASKAKPSINRESVPPLAQKSQDASSASDSLIQDLQTQIREDAARIRILQAQVRELNSSDFSEKRLGVIQNQCLSHDSGVSNTVQMDRAVAAAVKRMDEAFMRQVFERHASSRGMLSATALISALQEVEAPMLQTSTNRDSPGSVESEVFRRVDANLNGLVDFDECEASPPVIYIFELFALTLYYFRFMRAAQLPGDLEMLLEENQLAVLAKRCVFVQFIVNSKPVLFADDRPCPSCLHRRL
jgi:hypothetical protein